MMTLTQLIGVLERDSRTPPELLWWLQHLPHGTTVKDVWEGQGERVQGCPRPDWMVMMATIVGKPLAPLVEMDAYKAMAEMRRAVGHSATYPKHEGVERIRALVPAREVFG